MKGSGGQKSGTFAPCCDGGGVEIKGQLVGAEVNVKVEELAD
jgi:hypothetical protein